MKRSLSILVLAILTFCTLSASIIKDDPFEVILKKLEAFTNKFPQEKIHLHLDKPYYAAGDDIWLKAYVVNTKTSIPSTISDILYIELINDQDSLTKQLKLPMKSGITWGSFKLSDTLTEGNYRIRAYTQWMRNAGPEFFFDKTIKIGNSWGNTVFTTATSQIIIEKNEENITSKINFLDKAGKPYANCPVVYEVVIDGKKSARGKTITNASGDIEITYANNQTGKNKSGEINTTITLPNNQKINKVIPIISTTKAIDIQFFPESGNLVENLPTKIAVKATNGNGLGENISGKVVDENQTEILKFETKHLGMGAFLLNPLPGKTYTAIIKLNNGDEKTIPLPKAANSGYLITVNNTDSAKLNVKVLLSADLVGTGDLNLIAQHNGEVYFSAKVPTQKQLVSFNVSKMELPSGIIQLTLFAPTHVPVAERIVFVNNTTDKINLTIENLKPNYKIRENVAIDFNASVNNKPIQGSFSVAVTNASIVAPDIKNESNILTSLLLTSDLKGYVEQPNHYFLNDDVKTIIELDNLLLTQGWRKIDWKAIQNDQPLVFNFEPEKTMKISGRITKGGKPVVNGKVSLFSNSGGFFATDTLSDAEGRFNFDDITFGDSTRFIVQARTNKDNKNVQIDLDVSPNQQVTANRNTGDIEVNVNKMLMPYLSQSEKYFDEQLKRGFLNRTIQLKEVKIVEKKNLTPNSQNLNGAGRADQIITAKELENAFSLSMYLTGRVVGVSVSNGRAVSNRSIGFGGPQPMTIVLDGMRMGDDFLLDDINVFDIESVEVLRTIGNTAIYGSDGGNGLLVITTKRGAGTEGNYARYSPGIVTYSPKGFDVIKQFYSPRYDVNPDNKPDYRTTVYWNPHVITDQTGKVKVNYFNTDQPGTYRIVIEGIDGDGNLARNVKTYEVK